MNTTTPRKPAPAWTYWVGTLAALAAFNIGLPALAGLLTGGHL